MNTSLEHNLKRESEVPPDIESSSDQYALRFRGDVGEWFLQHQAKKVLQLLAQIGPSQTVLEVGGGHTQLTPSLVKSGHKVTVQGSDLGCALRVRRSFSPREIPFVTSSLYEPPFANAAFDVVVSIRMLAHVKDTERFLKACARVARKAVIVDFPSLRNFNFLSNVLFRLKKSIESDTRPYRCFRPSHPGRLLRESGFDERAIVPQFFLPRFQT